MRGRVELGALVAGLVVVALGALLGLDALSVLHLGFGWVLPVLTGSVGAILLAAGLADRAP